MDEWNGVRIKKCKETRKKKPVTVIRKTLFNLGAKIWNSIPENLRKLLKRAFKKQIHNLLLLDLQCSKSG